MVRLTKAKTLPEYVEAISGRIAALAQAHTLLAESRWDGADLRRLIEDELAPYRDGSGTRVQMTGDPVWLTPTAAQPVIMAIHELTTNAVKYGALSRPSGRVSVTWQCPHDGELRIAWIEPGGPPVRAPARRGFGSTAINRMIRDQLGGDVKYDWRPEGLRCELIIPIGGASRR